MSRFVAAVVTVVIALGSLTLSGILDPRPTLAGTKDYSFCPEATRLVTGSTHFDRHTLAKGVHLSEATLGKGKQKLRLNVVRVNLASRHTAVRPLHHAITSRHRLSKLARRPRLLAATNGTYFNFAFGAPTVPFIGPSGPVVLSRIHRRVVGISDRGRAQDGDAWLVGRVAAGPVRHRIDALNDVAPPPGIALYDPKWGDQKVPMPLLAESLAVRNGKTIGDVGVRRHVPPHGFLLVGTTTVAVATLYDLQRQGSADIRYHVNTTAARPFSQAYGVGTQVVATKNHVRNGLYCRVEEIFAARTDIAWSHHGHQLILATIESPHGSKSKGVDENQMSQVMVGLGAARSYALDGGGSTELVARLSHGHSLSIRTPGRRGHERPIPLGIGIYSRPVPKTTHHKHHPKPAAPPHKKRCLLGLLRCP